ncbi:MAG TPA: alcohol dehydrogenase catalytic domain-containing protein [Opitutaceae bacterium]|nr:alcohol dehydrogenase catalytic domain-containing protein [Opitutaceae bacterium]
MKTLFYPAFDQLEIRDLPTPEVAVGEVLLRVAACGLCGSELETFKNHSPRRQPPLVMGHEFCGTVEAVGPGVDSALLGKRFVSNSVISCGRCVRCTRGDTHLCRHRQVFGMHRGGAFADWVNVPQEVLIPWPENLTAAAACLAEPLANGVHVVNLTRHLPVHTALVIGAGPIGLMCQQALQAMRGAKTAVSDVSAGRLSIAQGLGATRVFNAKTSDVAQECLAWTDGEGVDLVIDAAGSALTKRVSLAALRPGGAAVWIGLHENKMEVDSYEITLPEKQVYGTYAAKKEELAQALELMRSGQVDVTSWTESVPLQDSVSAFHRMLRPGDRDIKAIFVP